MNKKQRAYLCYMIAVFMSLIAGFFSRTFIGALLWYLLVVWGSVILFNLFKV